jgi:2-methylfumaryl-CoA isomerase
VCWAPYRTIREVVERDRDCSPENPMFSLVEQPGIGTYPMPSSPCDFSATPRRPAQRAPLLGEHTDEILIGILGFSEAQVGKLHDDRIIAGPEPFPASRA